MHDESDLSVHDLNLITDQEAFCFDAGAEALGQELETGETPSPAPPGNVIPFRPRSAIAPGPIREAGR